MKAKIIKEGDDLQEFGLFLKDGSVAAGQAGEAGLGQKFIPALEIKAELTPENPRTDTERLNWIAKECTTMHHYVEGNGYVYINRNGTFLVSGTHQLTDIREAIDYCMDMEEGGGK